MDTLITFDEVVALIANPPTLAPRPNFAYLRALQHHLQRALQRLSCPQSNRTEQLRKLGKLQCYYLDQFNQKESSYATSKGCKTALQSKPRREGSLLPGFCVPWKCSGHLGDSEHMQIRVAH
jgi:hypothetical protein